MHILLSNDDGYLAEGLRRLAEGLAGLGRLTVVAPDRNRSGASNSLTLDVPLRMTTLDDGTIRVDGTPMGRPSVCSRSFRCPCCGCT